MDAQSNIRTEVMSYKIKDYWPQPKIGQLQTHNYFNPADKKPFTNIFHTDGRYFYCEDYHDYIWQATWIMDYDHPNGVMEMVDIYPSKSYQVWTKYRTTAFESSKEIPWGNVVNVGDKIDQELQISVTKSTFFTPPLKGRQVVNFVTHHNSFTVGSKTYTDVLEITYDQTFNNQTGGAHSWFAKGIGIVQLQWRGNNTDVGERLPADISIKNGIIKDKYPVLTS